MELKTLFNRCPTRRCDGTGWIKHGWEMTPCPDCLGEHLTTDGNHLENFLETLQKMLDGEFDDHLNRVEKEFLNSTYADVTKPKSEEN
jgi:hypothetical protein